MAFTNNAFCWHGINTTDAEAAKAFYTKVLGWDVVTQPMGEGEVTLFLAGGIPRFSLAEVKDQPSHWTHYLRVKDVDALTALAKKKGGDILVPPTDFPPGRFSVVTSPSGAPLRLYHEADPSSKDAPAGHGAVHWLELHSHALKKDLVWLKGTFGYETNLMPMPNGDYFILNDGDQARGGAMAAENKAPSAWLAWIEVNNVDDTLKLVKEEGGEVLSPLMEVPNVGRMAVVADSTGGTFGVITPPAA